MAYSRRMEQKTLQSMLKIYCHGCHQAKPGSLCAECQQLFAYAQERLDRCPFGENKPVCSQCTVHCYRAAERERVKKVMAYAGPRMPTRHPWLTLRYMYRQRHKKPPG
jgi:hypothetical protein